LLRGYAASLKVTSGTAAISRSRSRAGARPWPGLIFTAKWRPAVPAKGPPEGLNGGLGVLAVQDAQNITEGHEQEFVRRQAQRFVAERGSARQ